MYSLLSTTEEERVARLLVMNDGADVIVHVIDAKDPARMLPLTLQLLELGRPLVGALNMVDEAQRAGLRLDTAGLAVRLGIASGRRLRVRRVEQPRWTTGLYPV